MISNGSEARSGLSPTHLLSHPGHILGEVAHLPGQEALAFLQEGEERWAGRSPRNQHPVPMRGTIRSGLEERPGWEPCVPQPLDPPLALRQPPPLYHPSLTFLRIRVAQAGSSPFRWVTLFRALEVSHWGKGTGSVSALLGQGAASLMNKAVSPQHIGLGQGIPP